MTVTEDRIGSCDIEQKETIASRLRQLIGKRTVRSTAKEWGLAFSTLNNYLTRGTEPSLNVVLKIARIENVSIEWLAKGSVSDQRSLPASGSLPAEAAPLPAHSDDGLAAAWAVVFNALSDEERAEIIHFFIQMGARGVLNTLRTSSMPPGER